MNKALKTLGVLCLSLATFSPTFAQSPDQPLISLHTNLYDTYGVDNYFSLLVSGTAGAYIDVDCGYGPVEYQLENGGYDPDSQSLTGTVISCQVSSEGVVNIYGDKGSIDYFNGDGCAISTIEFADPESMVILSLSHNELESLDLSAFNHLQALYITDNPFDKGQLTIGPDKPMLQIIEMSIIDNLDPAFNLSDYPQMRSFDSMHNPSLTRLDPTGCPGLLRLSIDLTNVSELDLTQNEYLAVLNISDTAIKEIDLSHNTYLQELYATHMSGSFNTDVKLKSIDLSSCPDLVYVFLQGNDLTEIDLSNNPKLDHLWLQDNLLTHIDLSHNKDLTSVRLERNNFDFATLPENPGTWMEYEYQQRPLQVPRSYLRGSEIDFADRVLREGTQTYCAVFKVSESAPAESVEVPEALCKFENGILKITANITDSVYVAFANSMFPDAELRTVKFKIKNQEQFGAPDQKLAFTPIGSVGTEVALCVGVDGASVDTPKHVYADFGDGSTATFHVTAVGMPESPNVIGVMPTSGIVRIYVDEGEVLTALGIDGLPLGSIDMSALSELRQLRLTGTELYDLDLQWCRCLTSLQINGNHLSSFSLRGNNPDYGKNVLRHIDLASNGISELTIPENVGTIEYFDVSHNNISDINFTDCEAMQYIDVSYNAMSLLKVNYCSSLTWLDASHNHIEKYVEPETNVLRTLRLADNRLSLPTLPVPGSIADYIYAPQAEIEIPAKAPGVDLSSQYVLVDGQSTRFAWVRADGTPLVDGSEVECNDGVTRFLDPSVGDVYCRISHPAFPQFAGDDVLRTSVVEVAPMPTYVAAEFVTTGSQNVSLSLAATVPNTTICIDWNGDGTGLEQYTLGTTYTLFDAKTQPGRKVRVYSYEPDNNISVFSITGAAMESFDGSNLHQVSTLSVNGAGLTGIILPADAPMRELTLSGNAFDSFDLSIYPSLIVADLGGNKLRTIDASANPDLMILYAPDNQLTSVNFGQHPNLWMVALNGNQLEDIDLSQLPVLEQLGLHGNKLSHIDLSANPGLKMLTLDNNRFTFATLPLPRSEWILYTYGSQAPLQAECVDGVIDLSSEAIVDGQPTIYRWFIGAPEITEDYELLGEELVAGEEYVVDAGVTSFKYAFKGVVGALSNPLFPRMYMFTPMLTVTAAGIQTADTDNDRPVVVTDGLNIRISGVGSVAALYTLSGVELASVRPSLSGFVSLTALSPGTYILFADTHPYKLSLR